MKNLTLKLILSSFCLALICACKQTPKPIFNNNVISAAHPLASLAGKAMYAQGGNAFDAAVAAAFSLSVVESSMSGIGGRLQAIYRTSDGSIAGIDASTEVPIKYTPLEQKYSYGYETIGIPGVVAGLIKLQEDHGVLELNAVLAPAINYAENGYIMLPGEALRQQIAAEKIAEFKGSSHHFLKGNSTAYSAGDLIIQKDLAEVLKAIAANGRKGFYEGEVARKIVEDIQANGGIITLEDLQGSVEVILWPEIYSKVQELLLKEEPLLVKGEVDAEGSLPKVIATELFPLAQANQHFQGKVMIHFMTLGL